MANGTAAIHYMSLDAISGMAAHVPVERGHLPNGALGPGGVIPVAATEGAMTSQGLHLGGVYLLQWPRGRMRVRIVGVFAEKDPGGAYWPYRYFDHDFFTTPTVLQRRTQEHFAPLGEAAWYTVLDLRELTANRVPGALAALGALRQRITNTTPDAHLDVSPYATLAAFLGSQGTLAALLRLVSIPVLALALYFVAITASLVVTSQTPEIAVYTSRGARPGQVLLLYLLEWGALALPLALLAPLPAMAFAHVMGAATSFLRFTDRIPLPVHLSGAAFTYAGAATLLAVAAAFIPTWAALSRSVITARLRSARTIEQPLWQRAYVDGLAVALLGLLLVLFRHVSLGNGGAAAIAEDPGVYVLPAAFLVVGGLLAVRFVGWCLRLVDRTAGRRLSVAAVLPVRRIGRVPAQFTPVLLLLCYTAALGVYSAAAAHTLERNLVAAVRYQVGAPVRLQQLSPCSNMRYAEDACREYDDVDPVLGAGQFRPLPPFALNLKTPGVRAAAAIDLLPVTVQQGLSGTPATLIMITPEQYARVAYWDKGWTAKPESTYLRLLEQTPDAILLSPKLGTMDRKVVVQTLAGGGSAAPAAGAAAGLGGTPATPSTTFRGTFQNVGTLRGVPGAAVSGPFVVTTQVAASRLLTVRCGSDPCVLQRDVLMRLAPGTSPGRVTAALQTYGLETTSLEVARAQEALRLATPAWAGQSEALTIGFLVALAVTIAGYLLYAGLLLRAQLSQLGLLRAVGLDWSGVGGAVAVEQGILVVTGALSGIGFGIVAARLFLPLFQPAFTGPLAPLFVAQGPGDAVWQVFGVLLVLFALVIAGLLALLRRMHVGETVRVEEV